MTRVVHCQRLNEAGELLGNGRIEVWADDERVYIRCGLGWITTARLTPAQAIQLAGALLAERLS